VDAAPVSEANEIRSTLERQVTGSVRWTQIQERLLDEEGCDLFLELGPGGVLAGLLGRTRKGVACVSVSDAASVATAAQLLRG
jgi:[acyl-carrier-protein] S-malonyltransferase